ncbi:site-specific integrase [uncultured Duncaniella sp.]|jgi:site-specific recombinase XerD|uniref:site-specific integrase n=1 Tax=uncultured Duncaniella sp. TaxID=2768039 RepID=UPI0025AEFC80|nr:site-specific integrase [uncultured Duncaniella sp.]
MATFRFELNGRPTKNKTYVVYLRVTVGGKRKLIKTMVEIARPSDFNAKCKGENWVRGGVRDAKVLNAQLADILAKAKETYKELDKEGEVTTVALAKEMNTEVVSPSFMEFARERAQMIYDNGGWRNWRKYCGLINKLDAFRKKRRMADIAVADMTVELLTRFDNFLHKWENEREPGKLLHPNTIEVQFNILRTLVHRAIEVGIMEASRDPFLVFKYKGVKTVKEKLDDSEMERIINLELEEGSLIWHCKNYFLFSYYCAGIRAADLIQLRWGNVTGSGRLHYQMGKNHKERDLLLVEQAMEILSHYHREDAKATDYIFPLLSNDAEYAGYVTQADKDRMKPELRHKMYQDISSKNALINKYLKKIAEKAEIAKPLSMHISRHSFAHIAQEAGAESSAIKNILGHSNLATTERYMGSFDTSKIDETLRNVFAKKQSSAKGTEETTASKEEQAIELLKGMTPEQIMAVISAINK